MTQIPIDKPKFVFAGGCFWCTESDFRRLDGVLFTRVGYTGGTEQNPTYELVSSKKTGHAEANEIYYDPETITYEQLLEHFLTKAHDPTQLNRQGPDIGPQYRSAIFYANEAEKEMAQKAIDRVSRAGIWAAPIVTTLEPLGTFWPAEDYHQQYYEKYEKKYGTPHINEILKGR